jgi:hypothetical protein
MGHKKQHSGMQSKVRAMSSKGSSGQSANESSMGGREFGNVIEPMQAQMASGNDGLAADSGSSPQKPSKRRMKKAA